MNITKALSGCEYILYSGSNCEIETITSNSKEQKGKSVFFALKNCPNEMKYINEAISHGSVAIVSNSYIEDIQKGITYIQCSDVRRAMATAGKNIYDKYAQNIRLTGVTGTNGKTSFIDAAYQMYNNINIKSAYTGTLGSNIVSCGSVLPKNTTYDQSVYYELIRCAHTDGIKNIFSEVSSQGLSLGRCDKIDYNVAVFLNLSVEHLDYHNDMKSYYLAKKKLFDECNGLLIINIGDKYGRRLADEEKKLGKKVVTYGESAYADYEVKNIRTQRFSTVFDIAHNGIVYTLSVPLCGSYQVLNVAPAIILMMSDGFDENTIQKALSDIKPAKGRMECVYKGRPTVYIDYAHTPDAVGKALDFLRSVYKSSVICVMGCGGDRDRSKRAFMGRVATQSADKVIFTEDNPRNERSSKILSEIINSIEYDNYVVIPNRKKAVIYALENAKENDVVLIAGKGHEDYQIIKGEMTRFSDREIVKDFFLERNKLRL